MSLEKDMRFWMALSFPGHREWTVKVREIDNTDGIFAVSVYLEDEPVLFGRISYSYSAKANTLRDAIRLLQAAGR